MAAERPLILVLPFNYVLFDCTDLIHTYLYYLGRAVNLLYHLCSGLISIWPPLIVLTTRQGVLTLSNFNPDFMLN